MLPLRNPSVDNPQGFLPTARAHPRDAQLLRQLAEQHGISLQEALRQVLALYFRQPFLLSGHDLAHTGGDRLPQTRAPKHLIDGVAGLAEALKVSRSEVMRQIVRGTLKRHHGTH